MYEKKLEYLRSIFPKEQSISGILTHDVEYVGIGTPVIARIDPFLGVLNDDETGLTSYYKDEKTYTTAEELLKLSPGIVNKLLARSVGKFRILHSFCSMKGCYDFYDCTISAPAFHFKNEIPIIHDESGRTTAKCLSDVFDKTVLHDIESFMTERFKAWRYFNVTVKHLGQSKKGDLLAGINAILNSLKHAYPANRGIISDMSVLRVLLDTLSISMYQLTDVIPIYDVRKVRGVMVEFYLTSSAVRPESLPSNSFTFRFIFSKTNDGVFSIDGEKILRSGELSTETATTHMCDQLSNNMPNDCSLKTKGKKVHYY